MQNYLIGYDLNKSGQNYDLLIENIKKLSPDNWWHCLNSTWIIKSSLNSLEIAKILCSFIDENDELIVTLVTKDTSWYFKGKCSEWLQENL